MQCFSLRSLHPVTKTGAQTGCVRLPFTAKSTAKRRRFSAAFSMPAGVGRECRSPSATLRVLCGQPELPRDRVSRNLPRRKVLPRSAGDRSLTALQGPGRSAVW